MEIDLVSIIIPVYNVEEYLTDCLESVLLQSFQDIEILVIDDGSTDKSGAICDLYAEKDRRVKVVHKKNSGLSGARNVGIELSSGKYITFIDSDDVISPNYVSDLYNGIKDFDISACDFLYVPQDYHFHYEEVDDNRLLMPYCFSNIDAIKQVYSPDYHGVDFISCAKLYRKSLFVDNDILFPVGRVHEDAFTSYKLFYLSNGLSYIDEKLYYYRQRSGSITKSSFNYRKLDIIEATHNECEFFLSVNEFDILPLAFYDCLRKTKGIIREMMIEKKKYKKDVKKLCLMMRTDINKYKKIINIPLKKKVYYIFVSYFPYITLL